MKELFFLVVENMARRVMEWAQAHQVVYSERMPACEVEETWVSPILRIRRD